MSIRWTDDHCHLGWDVNEEVDAGEVDAMVAEARDAGVERLVTVGTDALRSAEAVRAAARHPGVVWATVGLHPHEARRGLDGVVDLLDEAGVVAVGECGLDYHYDHSPRPVQRDMFAAQIALAHERDLALVIHTARRGTTRSRFSTPRACPHARCSIASPAGPTRPGRA